MQAAVDVGHHLLLSHGLATQALRAATPVDTRVGIALNLFPIFAGDPAPRRCAPLSAPTASKSLVSRSVYRGEYTPGLFEDLGAAPPPIQEGDLKIISAPTDFLGVNYYNRWIVRAGSEIAANEIASGIEYVTDLPDATFTEMGWEVYPHGLGLILEELTRNYHPPRFSSPRTARPSTMSGTATDV